MFEHPMVGKSWLTYRICRDEEGEEEAAFRIETVLNVATLRSGQPGEELIDALTDFLLEHDDIDSVEMLPPGRD
jgi:hypothetical protein